MRYKFNNKLLAVLVGAVIIIFIVIALLPHTGGLFGPKR
jgi:hypothetical protein